MPEPLAEIEAETVALALEVFWQVLLEIERRFQALDVALVRALGDLHEQAEIGDAARQRAEMRELVELAGEDGKGDAAETWFEAERAAEARGDAHRSAH